MLSRALFERLDRMVERDEEIEAMLADPEVVSQPARYVSIARERAGLAKTVERYKEYRRVLKEISEAEGIIASGEEPELADLALEELPALEVRRDRMIEEIVDLFVSEDGHGNRNAIVEVRSGTGGDEAALFAAEIMNMYVRYAERKGWQSEIMAVIRTELGGVRHAVFGVKGNGAFRHLCFESGVHRVQRVPRTEAQGRIHTSTVTVAVLPEAESVEVDIKEDDLEIFACRASGPGGQHVNKTSSAIRIVHIPTGLVVECQDERSQHKNKARALRVLRAKLYEKATREQDEARGKMRRSQIKGGERSEKIRTYNFPENRITDHRIDFKVYGIEEVLLGGIDAFVEQLIRHDKAERLAALDREDG